MASPRIYNGGLNLTGTVFENGPALAQLAPTYISATIQWVDTIGGNNANSGLLPELPVATLAQAITNIGGTMGCLVIIGEGSAETLTVQQGITSAATHIIGCGIGASRPRYTCGGVISMFAAAGAGVRFRNLYFPASTAAATSRISFSAASCEIRECYFECGANDSGSAALIGANAHNTTVVDTSFVSVASRPASAITISSADTDCRFERLIIDGGTYGWTAAAFNITGAALRTGFEDVSLLRRSDFASVTGTSYQYFGLETDGTGSVDIAA